jgi:8-oxo-dGTP diphosphatase
MRKIKKQFIAGRVLLFDKTGKLLIIREAPDYKKGTVIGLYNFPGGKIKPGEDFSTGLKREIKEEVNLNIDIGKPVHIDEWRPIINDEQIQIICVFCIGKTRSNKNISLTSDHDDYKWIRIRDYKEHNLNKTCRRSIKEFLTQA